VLPRYAGRLGVTCALLAVMACLATAPTAGASAFPGIIALPHQTVATDYGATAIHPRVECLPGTVGFCHGTVKVCFKTKVNGKTVLKCIGGGYVSVRSGDQPTTIIHIYKGFRGLVKKKSPMTALLFFDVQDGLGNHFHNDRGTPVTIKYVGP
jgi:hypothetical protein